MAAVAALNDAAPVDPATARPAVATAAPLSPVEPVAAAATPRGASASVGAIGRWRLPPQLVAAALAGHSALGLGVAALLYLVALSGTLILFVPELDRWQQPQVPVVERPAPSLVQHALANLPGGPAAWRQVRLEYPSAELPRLIVTARPAQGEPQRFAVDPQGRPRPLAQPWSAFLHDLHEHLLLPGTAGGVLVGVLGIAMLALGLGGVLAHPRLFRDAFVLRAGAGERLRQADLHNRLSVWALPFHLMIAFSGAALGLALPVSTLVGQLGYGVQPAAIGTAFLGPAPGRDRSPAALPDMQAILRQVDGGDPAAIWRIIVNEPGRAAQLVRVDIHKPRRLVYGDRLFFDGRGQLVTPGGMLDQRPGLPFYNGLFALHFGTYGGTALRVVYGLLGLALCAMISSGMRIWLARQRARGHGRARLERLWAGWVWGSALALAASYGGALLSGRLAGAPGWLFAAALTGGLLLALAMREVVQLRHGLRWLFAVAVGVIATSPLAG